MTEIRNQAGAVAEPLATLAEVLEPAAKDQMQQAAAVTASRVSALQRLYWRIERNPVSAVGIGMAAGFLLSLTAAYALGRSAKD